jgi:CubicO group peptidase (beta-lactamase class C family)
LTLEHGSAAAILKQAAEMRIFPAAVAEVGSSSGVRWREAFGTLSFENGASRTVEDTVFDLASLTKPVATTSLVMHLHANGTLALDEPVADSFREWRGDDRNRVTIQDLLEHASGLAARLVDAPPSNRREFEHDICAMPLEYEPRSRSVYSDLGFILLGFLIADRGGTTLEALFETVVPRSVGIAEHGPGEFLTYGAGSGRRDRTAPTSPLPEDHRRGRMLIGEVHDNYAAVLGGVAGHAGLFGTAAGLGRFARAALSGSRGDSNVPSPWSPALMARATTKSTVPGSSRALGWDTMLATSSCGTRMSSSAFGHVGFTGCSLWIDPTRDRYFVLLTNRACGGGTIEQMRDVRRAFHDALADS